MVCVETVYVDLKTASHAPGESFQAGTACQSDRAVSSQGKRNAGTVLLLEDEPMIALDVEDILMEAGYSDVRTISSCRDAATWLEAGEPALVIVDPGLRDGICDAVVRSLVERDIPFIVHSGGVHSLVEKEPAFARGVWLSKPSPPADIVDAVARTMSGGGA